MRLSGPEGVRIRDTEPAFGTFALGYDTPVASELQERVVEIDARLREKHGMTADQTAVGALDLLRCRLAIIHPDRIEYGASVPKIGILLAFFALEPKRALSLDPQTRHELGLMVKISSNELAAKFSRLLGLQRIQEVLNSMGLYDVRHGGGLWVGKHYGETGERFGDPLADHSHAATVRQLLRFYLWLEQGKLVSPQASGVMRQIFESPEIPHERNKFVKGLAGKDRQIIRKSGSWEDWLHDTAVVKGPETHYVLVGLTRHRAGDRYLSELARCVDEALCG